MIVIDASVALKWVLPEEDSHAAQALLEEKLAAPALWLIEAANALWRHAVAKRIRINDAKLALSKLQSAPVAVIPIDNELARALELSVELRHPIYDCLYLAVALREDTHVVTADSRFIKAVSHDPVLKKRVRSLGKHSS